MSKTSLPVVTDDDFDQTVLASPVPVLVEFGAEWCPPCRALEPIVEQLAAQQAGRLKVVQVDTDVATRAAARYGVRAVPTVITFVGGQVHKRHTGATSMAGLLRLLPEG